MKKMQTLLMIVMAVATIILITSGCATTSGLTYLPPDTRTSIDPEIDNIAKKYIDYWIGYRASTPMIKGMDAFDMTLVIENIDTNNNVAAIYSWGYESKDWIRISGKLTPDGILLKWGPKTSERIMLAVLTENDCLSLEFRKQGYIYRTILTRYSSSKK